MKPSRPLPLQCLVDLREREVERLAADMAERHALRRRYLGNIERLQRLCDGSGADGASPAVSLNRGQFKQSLLALTQAQREELARHEAQMAAAELSLQIAARGHEVLRQLAAREQHERRRELAGLEQRQQDEVAAQCWQRTRS